MPNITDNKKKQFSQLPRCLDFTILFFLHNNCKMKSELLTQQLRVAGYDWQPAVVHASPRNTANLISPYYPDFVSYCQYTQHCVAHVLVDTSRCMAYCSGIFLEIELGIGVFRDETMFYRSGNFLSLQLYCLYLYSSVTNLVLKVFLWIFEVN